MKKDLSLNLEHARFLTRLMDARFKFLGISFGIDPLLNLIPGFGNILGSLTSIYLFYIAVKLNLPKKVYVQMRGNMIIDYILGVVPVAGVIADLFYKANVRNLKILEENMRLEEV